MNIFLMPVPMYKFWQKVNFFIFLLASLGQVPPLIAQNTAPQPETMFFEVQLLGFPAGFARLEFLGTRECKPVSPSADCDLYRYSVNLSKLRNLLGKVTIISDVYIRRNDREIMSNFTIIKTEQKRQDINIERDEQANIITISDGSQVYAQLPLLPQIQTLASLPLTIREQKQLGYGQLPLVLDIQLETLVYTTEQNGDRYIVKKDGKEYLIFSGPSWEPEKIVVLPIILLGTPIGDITATRLRK